MRDAGGKTEGPFPDGAAGNRATSPHGLKPRNDRPPPTPGGHPEAHPLAGTRPHRRNAPPPAEPYAVIVRDHEGVVPVTRHNARYSGIGGV